MAKSQGKRKPNATEGFKLEVLDAYRNRGTREVRDIMQQYGVTSSQLHRWIKEFPATKKRPPTARSNGAHDAAPSATNGKTRAVPNYSEISRLQRENQILSDEIEVLKKTIVVFARRV